MDSKIVGLGNLAPMDVDQRLVYTQRILRGYAIKKYKAVLLDCKKLAKDIAGESCTLGDLKGLSTYEFWTWYKSDRIGYDRDAYQGLETWVESEKDI